MSMEREGYVSLWVSTEEDCDKVEAAFDERYTDAGDWIPPPFARAFGFETFDPATREVTTLDATTNSLRDAVAGFSYDAKIGERFAREFGEALPMPARAVAMLYNFQFAGEPKTAMVDGTKWVFVGCVNVGKVARVVR